jgi:Na+/H+ antiporter NhaA
LLQIAKVGIIAASVLSGVIGIGWLKLANKRQKGIKKQ